MLYKTFVRPTLEYCTPIWNPYFAKDINVLESVQRRATKLLSSITSITYESWFRYLNFYSLYCRWILFRHINCYITIITLPPNTLFTFPCEEKTRGNSMKLFYPTVNYWTRHIFFMIPIINLWNNLPESIISVDSVSLFKKIRWFLESIKIWPWSKSQSLLIILRLFAH